MNERVRLLGVAVVTMVLCAAEPLRPPIVNGLVFGAALLLLMAILWPSTFSQAAFRRALGAMRRSGRVE